ncbi:hypothetical protein CYMTET_18201 [Cymbomonas tetramitiformis]|uniref:CUE domain-containing protein n=1 Tax=Cymbomonas tetramitiformis TaxID=36881 RepID=A0AAE0G8R0_9CHLO|nr:hypothetical protein CYMTET_18201 [Cymbomonas tetramitiformis]
MPPGPQGPTREWAKDIDQLTQMFPALETALIADVLRANDCSLERSLECLLGMSEATESVGIHPSSPDEGSTDSNVVYTVPFSEPEAGSARSTNPPPGFQNEQPPPPPNFEETCVREFHPASFDQQNVAARRQSDSDEELARRLQIEFAQEQQDDNTLERDAALARQLQDEEPTPANASATSHEHSTSPGRTQRLSTALRSLTPGWKGLGLTLGNRDKNKPGPTSPPGGGSRGFLRIVSTESLDTVGACANVVREWPTGDAVLMTIKQQTALVLKYREQHIFKGQTRVALTACRRALLKIEEKLVAELMAKGQSQPLLERIALSLQSGQPKPEVTFEHEIILKHAIDTVMMYYVHEILWPEVIEINFDLDKPLQHICDSMQADPPSRLELTTEIASAADQEVIGDLKKLHLLRTGGDGGASHAHDGEAHEREKGARAVGRRADPSDCMAYRALPAPLPGPPRTNPTPPPPLGCFVQSPFISLPSDVHITGAQFACLHYIDNFSRMDGQPVSGRLAYTVTTFTAAAHWLSRGASINASPKLSRSSSAASVSRTSSEGRIDGNSHLEETLAAEADLRNDPGEPRVMESTAPTPINLMDTDLLSGSPMASTDLDGVAGDMTEDVDLLSGSPMASTDLDGVAGDMTEDVDLLSGSPMASTDLDGVAGDMTEDVDLLSGSPTLS